MGGAVLCKGNSIFLNIKDSSMPLMDLQNHNLEIPFSDAIRRADPNLEVAKYDLKILTTVIDKKARILFK